MHVSPDISSFLQSSQDTADVFVGMRKTYSGLYRNVGQIARWALAIFIAPTAFVLMLFFLRKQRNKLKNLLSTDVDLSNYRKIRIEYDRLNAIFEVIGDRNFEKTITRPSWWLRVILRLMGDILQLIRKRRDAIGQALAQLDTTAPRTDLLEPVPEAELWEHRTKAYDYRF